jgi:hypothetical protein
MATLLFFPAQDAAELPRNRGRHSSHLAAAFAAFSSIHTPENVDLSLLEHLVSMEDDEGDAPRVA